MRRVLPMLSLMILLSNCTRSKAESSADSLDQARQQALAHITERYAALSDYSFSGRRCLAACASASPQIQHFRLQLRSPGLFRIELPDDQRLLLFDGDSFVSLDAQSKTFRRQQLKADKDGGEKPGEQAQAVPFTVLSGFVVEGWRAPPLNTAEPVPARWASAAAERPENGRRSLVLSRTLDDVDLQRVDYVYRWPSQQLWQKRFVDKKGQLLKRVVIEKYFHDKKSAALFPARWAAYDRHRQLLGWTELSAIRVNQGLAKRHFAAKIPAAYIELP